MKRIIRRLTLLTIFILAVMAFFAVPASAASKGKLLKEYTYKDYVKKDGSWKLFLGSGVKYHKILYTYNKKGDPVKITNKEVKKSGKGYSSTTKYKYTYKKGKKTKAKYHGLTLKYANGVPASLTSNLSAGDGYGRAFYYKFKSRYATYVKFVDIDPNDEGDHSTSIYNFSVTTKDGFPSKISRTDDNFPIEMTFYTSGARKGLVKEVLYDASGIMSDDQVEVDKKVFHYTYTIKKGQVVKAVRKYTTTFGYTSHTGYEYSEEGLEVKEYKSEFNFKYTKKKTNKKRCAAMINDIVANYEQEDGYGRPVLTTYWY